MTSAVDAVPTPEAPEGYPTYAYLPPKRSRIGELMVRLYTRAPKWTAPLAIATCLGGAVAYTSVSVPQYFEGADWAQPTCILKMTTGVDCPGCGGTRAFYFLMHGNLPDAARHHAMFVFVAPFLLYMYVAWSVNLIFGRKLPMLRVSPKTIGIVIAAWMGFSVLRNLPWAPFTGLYV